MVYNAPETPSSTPNMTRHLRSHRRDVVSHRPAHTRGPCHPERSRGIRTTLRSLPLLALAFVACQTAASSGGGTSRHASAALVDTGGRSVGTVQLVEQPAGRVALTGTLHDLPPGSHGIHLHAVGQCGGAAFASATDLIDNPMIAFGPSSRRASCAGISSWPT